MRTAVLTALLAAVLCPAAHGQSSAVAIPVNVRFSALEANAPPGTCGCFWLTGGAVDAAVQVLPHLSAAVEAGGENVGNVPGTARGLSEITLLAGPRYTLPVRRFSVSAQSLFGAAHAFNADLTNGTNHTNTATAFGMALGGFVEARLTHNLAVRPVQVDFLQTNLPNGVDDRQRNVRIGAGITFRVPVPESRR